MSLVFTSICPHPPIIIPTIGKENLAQVKATVKALEKLNKELIKAQPEIIIIISPHGTILPDAFCMNLCETYAGNFQQFGDFATKMELKGALSFAYKLRKSVEKQFPVIAISEPNLDHGTLVPLFYLCQKLKNFSILPMSYSLLNLEAHFDFGYKLKDEIINTQKRVAFIASGDLSHRLTPDAPAGYSPKGKVFDEKLIELLKNRDTRSILNLDPELVEEAGECGLHSIVTLLGIVSRMNYEPEVLSYEAPFGVGYLVMNFKL
jgi:aromatic ring-opening dioxygenase LigB subunit